MGVIPLTRCQFLIPFADIHDEIGGPTASLLAKFRLPTSLEEKADHFVPILPAIRFAEAAQRSQGLTDLGFRAARRLEFRHLSEDIRIRVGCSPTLLVALRQVCKWATLENTSLRMWLERDDDHLKICTRIDGTVEMSHLEHAQWLQNVFTIHVVRQFLGPSWMPATIAFEARYTPGAETLSSGPIRASCPGRRRRGSMCRSRI